MKPIFVYIHWSENAVFKEKSLMPFKEFEWDCRLDLCLKEDRGFQSHCSSTLAFINSERFKSMPEDIQASYRETEGYINQIQWV